MLLEPTHKTGVLETARNLLKCFFTFPGPTPNPMNQNLFGVKGIYESGGKKFKNLRLK